ncbi:MAG: M6 family metalloprotease domain-containing protein [Bacteroidaceae bacterium]|nr:M6 family metalloprotease domain-containing protein [Bacteroidaceae bacterium]
MKKRIHFSVLITLVATTLLAVPAKRVKRTITLTDGTQVEAVLSGDENVHFYTAADGTKYVCSDVKGLYREADADELRLRWQSRAQIRERHRSARRARRRAEWGATSNPVSGHKKGLVILVNYSDLTMKYGQSTYLDFFNKEGYSDYNMGGSVHDYFYSQSYGKFNLTFDVVGPVTLSKKYSYYGENDSEGNDKHAGEMVAEACRLADEYVNFSDYDWDNDGVVDQVYVIYAGYGESQTDDPNVVWPHEYDLSSANMFGDGPGALMLDGVRIDTYACSCELAGSSGSTIDGIGTACHEFSHCMCIPDMYDTDGKNFGMSTWDLMDYGCYNGRNGNGETPVGYTSYERMYCGWLTPVELDKGCDITGMKPLTSEPEAYIIYNQANSNEYYLLENHQRESWNRYSYGHGMLVLHVDFDTNAWTDNTVNKVASRQRMTIIPADNSLVFSSSGLAGDPWPGTSKNTSLTDQTSPAATLYRSNTDGRKFMNRPIENITEKDGLISFTFNGGLQIPIPMAYEPTDVGTNSFMAIWSPVEEAQSYELLLTARDTFALSPSEAMLLSEDFSGFNIGVSASNKDVGESNVLDNYTHTPGWTGYKLFATDREEVKIGTSKLSGYITTPTLAEPESGKVTVRILCRRYSTDTGTLSVWINDTEVGTIKPAETETAYVFTAGCNAPFQVKLSTSAKRAYVGGLEIYDGSFTAADFDNQVEAPRRERQTSTYAVTGTSYPLTDLDTSKRYSYKVRAINERGASEWSNMVAVELLKGGSAVAAVRPSTDASRRDAFDLQGRRINQEAIRRTTTPLSKGIYIIDGRKVVK